MNESNLWEWLRDVSLPEGHYSRIESPDTAPGFPDVHFQVCDLEKPTHVPHIGCGTIELKCNMKLARVPFPDEEKGLHKSQLRWIRDSVANGGIVWIIAECPGVIYIIHGKDAAHFNGATHDQLAEMAWDTMTRNNPKDAVTSLRRALGVPSNYRLFAEYY